MSSILNALKKLEQEHENRRLNQAGAVHKIDIRQAVQESIKPARIVNLRKGLWIALALIFASTFSYYFFEKHNNPQSIVTSDNNEADTVSENRIKKQLPVSSDRGIEQEIAAQVQKAEPESKNNSRMKVDGVPMQEHAAKPKSIDTAASANEKRTPNQIKSNPPSTSNPSRNPVESQIPIQPQAAETARHNLPSADKQAFASVPKLTDGRLRIQAIAWAPAAADRMAVINNRVVREGYAVDGFSIETIGENEVLVSEGDMRWKVIFGHP